jgi:hypothetical protein
MLKVYPAPILILALCDYSAKAFDELSFEEEDCIAVLDMDSPSSSTPDWLYGELNGLWGRFPRSFVEVLTPEEAEQEELSASTLTSHPHIDKGWFSKMKGSVKRLSSNKSLKSPSGLGDKSEKDGSDDEEGYTSPPNVVITPVLARHPSDKKGRRISLTIGTISRITSADEKRTSSTPTLLEVDEKGDGLMSRRSVTTDKRSRRSSLNPVNMFAKSKDNLSPLSNNGSIPTTSVGPIIAMVSAPAAVKELWTDVMGGTEAVKALGYSKQEIKRQEVIYEIFGTEKDYIQDIEYVIEVR